MTWELIGGQLQSFYSRFDNAQLLITQTDDLGVEKALLNGDADIGFGARNKGHDTLKNYCKAVGFEPVLYAEADERDVSANWYWEIILATSRMHKLRSIDKAFIEEFHDWQTSYH